MLDGSVKDGVSGATTIPEALGAAVDSEAARPWLAGGVDRDTHVELFLNEAHGFVRSLGDADLDAVVPTCPEWNVRDLARHVGSLHRWAASIVDDAIVVETWRPSEPIEFPDEANGTDAWAQWLARGADGAARSFLASDPAARVWAWGGDQHARFWPRRMLVETAVHRLDLLAAVGLRSQLPAALAVEAIDEFLENLRYAARWRPALHGLGGEDQTLTLRASDTGDGWQVRLTRTGWWWDRSTTAGDVAIEGSAGEILLELHGRPANVVVEGDEAALGVWRRATIF